MIYYILWKTSDPLKEWAKQVTQHVTKNALATKTINHDAVATMEHCVEIRKVYTKMAQQVTWCYHLDLLLQQAFLYSKCALFTSEHTRMLLDKSKRGADVFSSAMSFPKDQHEERLRLLYASRELFMRALNDAFLSEMKLSKRVIKIQGNLAKLYELITKLRNVQFDATNSTTATNAGFCLRCFACKKLTTDSCKLCNGGVAFCSSPECLARFHAEHGVLCASRKAIHPDMTTSAHESMTVFSVFFEKYPNALNKIYALCPRAVPNSVVIVLEAHPEKNPLLLPMTDVRALHITSPESLDAIEQMMKEPHNKTKQAVMLVDKNGVSMTNCFDMETMRKPA